MAAIAPEMRWDVPLRLLGGLHYLALTEDIDPWSDVRSVLAKRREWLARFVAEQRVQTNEVRRCWGLLPVFLLAARDAGGPLDLVELGTSAGLNLVWDRYRYRYEAGEWGGDEARVVLFGEERLPVPPDLLAVRPAVRRRTGIDLSPIDVATEQGARLLECFVWADQAERIERLRRAIDALREDPPELIRGDYVRLLPSLLEERDGEVLTVVYQTASFGFLTDDERASVLGTIEAAGRDGRLAFVTAAYDPERAGCFPLDLTLWPGGRTRRAAYADFHGAWLEWVA